MKHISSTQLFSYALFVLSAVILLLAFLVTQNVSVIKNWTLQAPSVAIHAGDTVTLISRYTKLRDVSGKSTRYIECKNRDGIYIRYPLNEATADRSKGTGGTGIVVVVPTTIPDVPTTCKFTVNVLYDVYPWRKVSQTQSSNEFKLLPKTSAVNQAEYPSTTQKNPSQETGIVTGHNSVFVSYAHTTADKLTKQSDLLQQ